MCVCLHPPVCVHLLLRTGCLSSVEQTQIVRLWDPEIGSSVHAVRQKANGRTDGWTDGRTDGWTDTTGRTIVGCDSHTL